MDMMTDARQVIITLKEIQQEMGLSNKGIVKLVEENGEYVSESTVARVFRKGSEDIANTFRYENSLRPIANALLKINQQEQTDDLTTQGFKVILRYKMEMIEKNEQHIKELEEELKTIKSKERKRYDDKMDKETKHFTDSLSFLQHQIDLKDTRIDALLSANAELTTINNQLVKQLMNCPLRKEGC